MRKSGWSPMISLVRRRHADTWVDLKGEMRMMFVLASYARDLYNKFMEEYRKEMEVASVRANVLESSEVTMTLFLHGLNRDI
ncbi:hypothetical protein CR513_03023, partial [Mucuna pruriens]